MLAGRDARSGTRVATWLKVPGYDLTLSAPKSVSLLWALGDDHVAATVREAHDEAVDAALAYIEAHACVVRRGRGGRARRRGDGLIAAAFRHRTSREADPQLHTHVVVANMTAGPDGDWSSLFGTLLFRHSRAAGCIYQSTLRRRLTERLGIEFGPVTNGYAEIVGIDVPARRAFSRRRIAIERAMAAHGGRSRHAAQIATLDTRPDKPEPISEGSLRSAWSNRAAEIGLDVRRAVGRPRRVEAASASDAELADILTEKHAAFERRRVVEAVASSSRQGLLADEVERRVEEYLNGPLALALPTGRWTTPEMLAIEAEVLELARGHLVAKPDEVFVEAAFVDRASLGEEQRSAVRHVTDSCCVSLVVGHAGAGKTFALDAARGAWEAAGHPVLGCSLSARAARQLESAAGIWSDTADRLLLDLDGGRRRLTERAVVVVDEAGMLGSRRLVRLLRHTTKAKAKLILVGDPKQLPEIDAGGLFAALAERLGYAELTQNRRQRDNSERQAACELRSGEVDKALARLSRAKRITTDSTMDGLRDAMVRDWHVARSGGADVLMLCLHRSDAADLNARARERLLAAGELGEPVAQVGDLELRVGERVMTLRNNRLLGLVNGAVGTVVGSTSDGVIVEDDNGGRTSVPYRYIGRRHVAHAYASTVHKSQGLTCDVALLLGDDTLFTEAGYTGITRGRGRNQVYVVRGSAADELDALRRSLARSAAKQTAIEQLELGRA